MITDTDCSVYYTADGSTSVYQYPFRIIASSDLVVTTRVGTAAEIVLALTAGYTVSGVGATTGGEITLVAGDLAVDTILAIKRIRPITQTWDVRNQGSYLPERVENSADHIIMICQQLAEGLTGTARLHETVDPSVVSSTLPLPTGGALLAWNAGGTAIENVTVGEIGSGDSVTLPDDYGVAIYAAANVFTSRTLTAGAGISITNGTGVSGNPTITSTSPPTGSIVGYGAAAAPTGWLLCDGSVVSRTTYAALYAVIGTTWGVGDGSTTFNVPDSKGRFPIGYGTGAGLTARALGAKGGEESHTITITELPSHSHDIPILTGSHADGSEACIEVGAQGLTPTAVAGGATAMAMLPPFWCQNYIIKT